jgi:putative transposase
MNVIKQHRQTLGTLPLCDALDIPKASFYRHQKQAGNPAEPTTRQRPKHALSTTERQDVVNMLNSPLYVDLAPSQIYTQLLEEGKYVCSTRTMYRLLAENDQVRERRNVIRHPSYTKPELLATGPNEVWSWDITKLKGPAKWTYYYLYVILDIFSRYVVGWMIAERESGTLAKKLIEETCYKQNIDKEQLTLHADRGSSMKSKVVAHMLSDLGVTKTHSRPRVSNDNPFSESQFKTMKYRPQFPKRFGSIQDARLFCVNFFQWYNEVHRHSGIALYTPSDVHYGRIEQIHQDRQKTLDAAYKRHPNRFVNKPPKAALPPKEVWINPPKKVDDKLLTGA